jgi:transcriptional regulator with XRE-family HTH domain
MIPLTLHELAAASGVSVSHLARIESGSRFPSPRILCKIAKALGFTEQELLTLAGYLSAKLSMLKEEREEYAVGRLDMRVAKALAQEPVEVQRAVLKMLPVLKSIAKDIAREDVGEGQFSPDELEQFKIRTIPAAM